MLALLYRTIDLLKWGAGKGSNLTAAEVDTNFWELQEAVNNLIANPTAPNEIQNITVNGNNQMLITMEDTSTFGPFDLPVASINFTGDFIPNHAYKTNDFLVGDEGVYFVKRAYTSGPTFNPAVTDGQGAILNFVIPYPSKLRIGFYWPTKPGTGLPADSIMSSYLSADDFYFADFSACVALLDVAPADGEYSLLLYHEDTPIASITWALGETAGVFAPIASVPVQVMSGERVKMAAPSAIDTAAYGLSVNLVGKLGIAEVDSSS